MPKVNELVTINLKDLVEKNRAAQTAKPSPQVDTKDFGETVSDFLSAVNENQKAAAGKVAEVIQGKSENLHEAMAMLEESSLSFQLMIEIRNKLLESYKEIERMQV